MSKKIYIGSQEIAGGDGRSAYQSWLDQGNVGTEEQFVASLNGVGITSVVQTTTSTAPGGTNVVTVTKTDGSTSTFQFLNGTQGNTGSSVDYAYELVNNVTTNDATKGLSAAQGVYLQGEVDQLGLEVVGKAAHEDPHAITHTIPRGNTASFDTFVCEAGVTYGLDAELNEATASGNTNIFFDVNGTQVERVDIVSPSTHINSASEGKTLYFETDTTVTIRVWLAGDYNTSRDLTVTFIEQVPKTNGRLDYDEEAIAFLMDAENAPTTISASIFEDKSTFITTLNTAFATFATSVSCSHACMQTLESGDSWEVLFEKVNANLRYDALDVSLSNAYNAKRLNAALARNVYRFKDATIGSSTFSRELGVQADEPSVIISDDGGTMYLYAKKFHGRHYRFSTYDGVKWTEELVTLTGRISGTDTLMHPVVNYIKGTYYLIGVTNNTDCDLLLYTSTDGLNFTYAGIIFEDEHVVSTNATLVNGSGVEVSGLTLKADYWGNCYIIFLDGTYYLYYEFRCDSVTGIGWTGWEIALATCTNPLYDNGDGTVGDWVDSSANPVLKYKKNTEETCCNPDFASLVDNQPVKHNGYYYLYYHGHNNYSKDPEGNSYRDQIYRAKSTDLVNWIKEGACLDVRDIGTTGEYKPNVSDHTVTEFKGRTYMFYSYDINSGDSNPPTIKYLIDDRCFRDLLALRP